MIRGKELLERLGIENQELKLSRGGSYFNLETILDRIIQVNEPKDFESASRPLIKFLAENHHPHVKAIVESNKAELIEGIEAITVDDYVVDI